MVTETASQRQDRGEMVGNGVHHSFAETLTEQHGVHELRVTAHDCINANASSGWRLAKLGNLDPGSASLLDWLRLDRFGGAAANSGHCAILAGRSFQRTVATANPLHM